MANVLHPLQKKIMLHHHHWGFQSLMRKELRKADLMSATSPTVTDIQMWKLIVRFVGWSQHQFRKPISFPMF